MVGKILVISRDSTTHASFDAKETRQNRGF